MKKQWAKKTAATTEAKKNVYDIVTERIMALLEQGVIPWRKPWKTRTTSSGRQYRVMEEGALNWTTGLPFGSMNQMMLGWDGEWATFKQITEAGGKVKKGAKSSLAIRYETRKKKDDKREEEADENEETEGEDEFYRVPKFYMVFEINTQVEGLTSKRRMPVTVEPIVEEEPEVNPIEEAETIVAGFMNGPKISHASGSAVYHPFYDRVTVPPMKDYDKPEEYYSTLFHELIHSTGHKSRLARTFGNKFGDELYSKEELVAEMGAAMLCGIARIEQVTIENSAAYIKSWLKSLNDDRRMVLVACQAAQKATDLILGNVEPKKEGGSFSTAV